MTIGGWRQGVKIFFDSALPHFEVQSLPRGVIT